MASSIHVAVPSQIKGDGRLAIFLFLKLGTNNRVTDRANYHSSNNKNSSSNGNSTGTERWPIERPKKYFKVFKAFHYGSKICEEVERSK